tara:strand:- start:5060 stop:5539 length:480 start_codon:yes stop_codon:yes gene_type:complete
MRIKQIKNKEVRELALSEMSKQTGLSMYYKSHLLNLHLMMLDFQSTKNGSAYWEAVYNFYTKRPYRDILGTIGGKRVTLAEGEKENQYLNVDNKPKRKTYKQDWPKGTKRICSFCKIDKDLETQFSNSKYNKGGKKPICKNCISMKKKAKRAADKKRKI